MFAPMPKQGAHLTDVGLGPKGAAEELVDTNNDLIIPPLFLLK